MLEWKRSVTNAKSIYAARYAYRAAKGQTASHMNRDIEIYFSISHVMSHVSPTMFNVQQVSSTAVLVFFPRLVSSPIFPGMSYRIA